jgi:hypothetical protein
MTTQRDDVPDPFVAPETDLRGLTWMRLDIMRLLDSDLFALSSGDEFKAALALWCKSWHQTPAGSLPTDDRVLAHLSGAGARWPKVRGMALRGWIKCSDGRLYHPVVAEQARTAWEERLAYQQRDGNQSTRKARSRAYHKALRQELRNLGITVAWNETMDSLRQALSDAGGSPETVARRVFSGDSHATSHAEPVTPVTRPVTPNLSHLSRDQSRTCDATGTAKTGRDVYSVAIATAGGPPAGPPATTDPIKSLFDRGLAVLGGQPTARSLLGKLRREHGDAAVLAAISAAEAEAPSEPVAWLIAACRSHAASAPASARRPSLAAVSEREMAVAAEMERREAGGNAH